MSTLIVSATYDNSYPEWYERLPDPKVRESTAAGGHPSNAFIWAYRMDLKRHDGYLFLQDSLEPLGDVLEPFLAKDAPVVAWARFPLFFDNPEQEARVRNQYTYPLADPTHGIFGPIFYASRKAMQRLDRLNLFPRAPESKMDAQGTERAWAFAFNHAGIPVAHLHDWSNEFVTSGDALPFRKVFAGRQ